MVCLPGGPGRAAEYLGDLGGLDKVRQLILLDPRGVGRSEDPADPATFRVDRLVADVDALRAHLGLEQVDVLAHSAGAVLATLYAAAHPERVARLALITPGLAAIGVEVAEADLRAVLDSRAGEPWYPEALAAMEQLMAGDLAAESFSASRPFFYGRWDETARAHSAAGMAPRHQAARQGYFAGVELDPAVTRAALGKLTAPVLLYAGERDPLVTAAMVREAVAVFSNAAAVVQPGAGHFPWVDDPARFATTVGSFLTGQ